MREQILQVAREARDRDPGCARRTPTGAALLAGPPEPLVLACYETHGYESGLDPAFVRAVADDLAFEALQQPVDFTLEQLEHLLDEAAARESERDLAGALLRAIPTPLPRALEPLVLSFSGSHPELVGALLAQLAPPDDPWSRVLAADPQAPPSRLLADAASIRSREPMEPETATALRKLVLIADDPVAVAEIALALRRGKVVTAAIDRLVKLPGGGEQLARLRERMPSPRVDGAIAKLGSDPLPPPQDETARRRWFERLLRDGVDLALRGGS